MQCISALFGNVLFFLYPSQSFSHTFLIDMSCYCGVFIFIPYVFHKTAVRWSQSWLLQDWKETWDQSSSGQRLWSRLPMYLCFFFFPLLQTSACPQGQLWLYVPFWRVYEVHLDSLQSNRVEGRFLRNSSFAFFFQSLMFSDQRNLYTC